MIRLVSALALTATLLLPGAQLALAQATPAQIVKERQEAMKANWPDYFRAIAGQMRASSPDLRLIATKAAQASEHVTKFKDLFPPGTGRDVVPTTRAKPTVWTDRADFEAALTALADASTTMSEDAKKGDVEKVKADWTKLAKACGACHGGKVDEGGKFRFEKE
jgi:cytochrome c556